MMAVVPDKTRIDVFIEFVDQHKFSLRAYIRALGVKSDWVDDLAQEAFVVAYQRLDDFDPEKDLGHWVRGIARKLVAAERQRKARSERIIAGPLTDYLMAKEQQRRESIMQKLEHSQLVGVMNQCIDKLPQQGQKLLYQRYHEKISTASLAREFNISIDALRHRLMRIRQAVKKCITQQVEGGER